MNLEVLADNRGLTPVQQSHRDLLCNFLALAAEYNANSAAQPASAGGVR